MNEQPGFLRRHAVRLMTVALIGVLYGFARLPALPERERQALASRFAFTRLPLPTPPKPGRRVREVHPDYERISTWISSVGAGIALNDLDGDGLPNDACLVDTRIDRMVVVPVPGTGKRYPLFTLDPDPALFHDRRTMSPMGCLPGDWNEDGRMDLLVYCWGRPPVAFLRHAGGSPAPSAALYRPVAIAPAHEIWNTNALTSADVDGDGRWRQRPFGQTVARDPLRPRPAGRRNAAAGGGGLAGQRGHQARDDASAGAQTASRGAQLRRWGGLRHG